MHAGKHSTSPCWQRTACEKKCSYISSIFFPQLFSFAITCVLSFLLGRWCTIGKSSSWIMIPNFCATTFTISLRFSSFCSVIPLFNTLLHLLYCSKSSILSSNCLFSSRQSYISSATPFLFLLSLSSCLSIRSKFYLCCLPLLVSLFLCGLKGDEQAAQTFGYIFQFLLQIRLKLV